MDVDMYVSMYVMYVYANVQMSLCVSVVCTVCYLLVDLMIRLFTCTNISQQNMRSSFTSG